MTSVKDLRFIFSRFAVVVHQNHAVGGAANRQKCGERRSKARDVKVQNVSTENFEGSVESDGNVPKVFKVQGILNLLENELFNGLSVVGFDFMASCTKTYGGYVHGKTRKTVFLGYLDKEPYHMERRNRMKVA